MIFRRAAAGIRFAREHFVQIAGDDVGQTAEIVHSRSLPFFKRPATAGRQPIHARRLDPFTITSSAAAGICGDNSLLEKTPELALRQPGPAVLNSLSSIQPLLNHECSERTAENALCFDFFVSFVSFVVEKRSHKGHEGHKGKRQVLTGANGGNRGVVRRLSPLPLLPPVQCLSFPCLFFVPCCRWWKISSGQAGSLYHDEPTSDFFVSFVSFVVEKRNHEGHEARKSRPTFPTTGGAGGTHPLPFFGPLTAAGICGDNSVVEKSGIEVPNL